MVHQKKVKSDANPDVRWALYYTLLVICINLTGQLIICLHSVWVSSLSKYHKKSLNSRNLLNSIIHPLIVFQIYKENAFELLIFGFLSLVNNAILAYFWAYAGIPGVDGFSPMDAESEEEVTFDVTPLIGWTMSILFILFGSLELLLIKPCYNKLCWIAYQKIGSDVHMQQCYKNYEVAKGSWILFFWFTGVECSTIFFFENNTVRAILLAVLALVYVGGLAAGYQAVSPIYSLIQALT